MDSIIDKIINSIREQWVLAGHSLTQAFEKSIRAEVTEEGGKTVINFWGRAYGLYQNFGVTADRIPYTKRENRKGKSGGKKSKYITGLKNWVKLRMGISDEREALGIAFAIAEKHKDEGMRTKGGVGIGGSGFLEKVKKEHEQDIRIEIMKKVKEDLTEKLWH